MNVAVTPSVIRGEIEAIGSKSAAHRALLAAALFGKRECSLSGITLSEDVSATVDCLTALGTKIERRGENFLVFPADRARLPKAATLNVRESGSTYRFVLPIAAALGVNAEFIGSDRLFARPSQELFAALGRGGCVVSGGGRRISGKFDAHTVTIDASESSQYVTGLLFALAITGGGRLFLTGKRVSTGYIDLTVRVLRDFGVAIQKTADGFSVGGNLFAAPAEYLVEGDWSNAAFFLAAGALTGKVAVKNLKTDSLQKDKAIAEILRRAGADVAFGENRVCVEKRPLVAFSADAEEIPDAVPILSVVAAFAEGESRISGVSRLKGKESDRLGGVIETLRLSSISARTDGETLQITGGQPKGAAFFANNDHRMAMSQAILGAAAAGITTISGAECVKKSYPAFFEDFALLGGKTEIV